MDYFRSSRGTEPEGMERTHKRSDYCSRDTSIIVAPVESGVNEIRSMLLYLAYFAMRDSPDPDHPVAGLFPLLVTL